MKAAQFKEYGGPDVLEINPEAPEPAISPGQVLVEAYAGSINPFDVFVLSGGMKDKIPLQLPMTIGGDFAGKIIDTGEEVFGQALAIAGNSGSFAEKLAVNKSTLAPRPKTISFEHAAALPLVGCSAIQVLEDKLNLQPEQKILIHGGAGGIGHLAIQFAKTLGAYVATTVSSNDVEFAKTLGANEVIDYKTQDFTKIISDYDAVYDLVGGETTDKSFSVLKNGGAIVSMLGQPNPTLAEKYGVTAIAQMTKVNTETLTRLANLVDGGKIKVYVDKVFPLEQVKEAFIFQSSHSRGKVVIQIKL